MKRSGANKRVPAWLRGAGWFGLILLALAMPLSLVRWLMEGSHQKVVSLVKQSDRHPKRASGKGAEVSLTQRESSASRGIPLADVPLVGVYVGDDEAATKELEKQLEEIRSLLAHSQHNECWVDGVLGFRAMLAKMGMTVPDTMTEADAATEVLRQTERFSDVLAQWREAVGKGTWDFSSMGTKDLYAKGINIVRAASSLQSLLDIMAEARLRTGDTVGAWGDMQTINSTMACFADMPASYGSILRWQTIRTAQAGIRLGGWTDAQLTEISTMMGRENALSTARRDTELRKLEMADYLANFRDHQSEIQEDFSRSKSAIDRMINRFGVATATDQQMSDNLAVIEYRMDRQIARFDPETGFYLGESAGDDFQLPRSKPSDVSFDKYYYMFSEMYGGHHDWVPQEIIRSQSTIDHTRIAAALELQRRATGRYPESLAALGDSIPRDIATGQPYFYQRDADGGYKLWGTGIDGKGDGGDERADVTWTHRPVKK